MKKKLEAELISIAHRILKLKNKSEIVQLHQETQKLYEKLTVLRFVEENFADVKPTIGQSEIEEKIEAAFQTVLEKDEEEIEAAIAIEAPIEASDRISADSASSNPLPDTAWRDVIWRSSRWQRCSRSLA